MKPTNFDTAVVELECLFRQLADTVEHAVQLAVLLGGMVGNHHGACGPADLSTFVCCEKCGEKVPLHTFGVTALQRAKLQEVDGLNLLDLLSRCATVVGNCRYVGWEVARHSYPGFAGMAEDLLSRLTKLLKKG